MIESTQSVTATVSTELFTLDELLEVRNTAFWFGVAFAVTGMVVAAAVVASNEADAVREQQLMRARQPTAAEAQRLAASWEALQAAELRVREAQAVLARQRVGTVVSTPEDIGASIFAGVGNWFRR